MKSETLDLTFNLQGRRRGICLLRHHWREVTGYVQKEKNWVQEGRGTARLRCSEAINRQRVGITGEGDGMPKNPRLKLEKSSEKMERGEVREWK